jgi:hypothetical protein
MQFYDSSVLANLTAAKKKPTVPGTLAAKINWVIVLPQSGSPEESSKTQPTPAIAAMQDKSKNTELIGVIAMVSDPLNGEWLNGLGREPVFGELLG